MLLDDDALLNLLGEVAGDLATGNRPTTEFALRALRVPENASHLRARVQFLLGEARMRYEQPSDQHAPRALHLPAWDGRDRLSTWTTRLLGAPDVDWLSGRYMLSAALRRALWPGDTVYGSPIVLVGRPGVGKTTALQTLSGGGMPELREMEVESGWLSAPVAASVSGRVGRLAPKNYRDVLTTQEAPEVVSAYCERPPMVVRMTRFDREGLLAEREQLWAQVLAELGGQPLTFGAQHG